MVIGKCKREKSYTEYGDGRRKGDRYKGAAGRGNGEHGQGGNRYDGHQSWICSMADG